MPLNDDKDVALIRILLTGNHYDIMMSPDQMQAFIDTIVEKVLPASSNELVRLRVNNGYIFFRASNLAGWVVFDNPDESMDKLMP